MIGFSEQDNPSIGRESLIGSLDLDRTIEFWLNKVILCFTHRVILLYVEVGCDEPFNVAFHAMVSTRLTRVVNNAGLSVFQRFILTPRTPCPRLPNAPSVHAVP